MPLDGGCTQSTGLTQLCGAGAAALEGPRPDALRRVGAAAGHTPGQRVQRAPLPAGRLRRALRAAGALPALPRAAHAQLSIRWQQPRAEKTARLLQLIRRRLVPPARLFFQQRLPPARAHAADAQAVVGEGALRSTSQWQRVHLPRRGAPHLAPEPLGVTPAEWLVLRVPWPWFVNRHAPSPSARLERRCTNPCCTGLGQSLRGTHAQEQACSTRSLFRTRSGASLAQAQTPHTGWCCNYTDRPSAS